MTLPESFIAAVENDDLDKVRHCLASLPKEEILDSRLDTGDAVIHRAAGSPKVLQLLIELGADINVTTSDWHGLRDPDDDDEEEEDSSDEGEDVEGGKKVKKFVDAKLTTLHLSAASGYVECVRILARANDINVNARDGEGSTSLHLASTSGHLECVICLLANGASCQLPDHWGNTALHEAAWNGEIECCLALLAAGADLTRPGNERKTAADMADGDGYYECSSLLRNLEGCWNTALVAQLMLDVRQMSKRERKLAVVVQEQAMKVLEMEGNLHATANALKDERKFTSQLETDLKDSITSSKTTSQALERKVALNEDKVTLTLGRVAAVEREIKSMEEEVDDLRKHWDQSSPSQQESTILASLSELQFKFGAMMEKLSDKLGHLEKKIHAVEEFVVKAEVPRGGGGERGEEEEVVVGKKKKPKRKSGPSHQSQGVEEDEAASLIRVAESTAARTPTSSAKQHVEPEISPCSVTYAYPTPGSSVSAGTPSPRVDVELENQTVEEKTPPKTDLSSVRHMKLMHAEFLRNTGNERFSEAIGNCVETVAKLKDLLRLVTDQTRPSVTQVKAALDQWTKTLEDLMEQQSKFQDDLDEWTKEETLAKDFPKVPTIPPLPNAPETDVRVIAEQLASLHLAAKHKSSGH